MSIEQLFNKYIKTPFNDYIKRPLDNWELPKFRVDADIKVDHRVDIDVDAKVRVDVNFQSADFVSASSRIAEAIESIDLFGGLIRQQSRERQAIWEVERVTGGLQRILGGGVRVAPDDHYYVELFASNSSAKRVQRSGSREPGFSAASNGYVALRAEAAFSDGEASTVICGTVDDNNEDVFRRSRVRWELPAYAYIETVEPVVLQRYSLPAKLVRDGGRLNLVLESQYAVLFARVIRETPFWRYVQWESHWSGNSFLMKCSVVFQPARTQLAEEDDQNPFLKLLPILERMPRVLLEKRFPSTIGVSTEATDVKARILELLGRLLPDNSGVIDALKEFNNWKPDAQFADVVASNFIPVECSVEVEALKLDLSVIPRGSLTTETICSAEIPQNLQEPSNRKFGIKMMLPGGCKAVRSEAESDGLGASASIRLNVDAGYPWRTNRLRVLEDVGHSLRPLEASLDDLA
jgi:hypothetical protein